MAGLQKVLLIEDNLQLQEIYTVILQTNGYQVEVASNGPHGLQKAMMFIPDIIFLDIMMPGMNGLEVLQLLRQRPEYNVQHSKIVLLTNLGHDERVEEAWRQHADGYVIKAEISPEELIEVIHSLENPNAPSEDIPAAFVPAPTGPVPGTAQPVTETIPIGTPEGQPPAATQPVPVLSVMPEPSSISPDEQAAVSAPLNNETIHTPLPMPTQPEQNPEQPSPPPS